MAEPTPQTYANHRRFVPLFHLVLFPAVCIVVIAAVVRLIQAPSAWTAIGLLQALVLFGAVFVARIFALAAQDRVIRLEEQLRLQALFPKEAGGMIEKLQARQYIGLRFASDGEFHDLTRAAIDSQLSEEEIKKRIKTWRPDYHRL